MGSALLVLGLLADPLSAQITVRSGSAADAAGIATVRNQFRTDLGGGTSVGANGLFDDLTRQRREINWDGVPDGFSAPNGLPANFFNSNSPRGAVFSTPGTGFQVSATAASGTSTNFGNIDPSYSATFLPFSAQRLFTPIGAHQMDVTFFVPGTSTPAGTRGFGVVFSDVEQAGTTAMEFFDVSGVSLGAFAAPPQSGATGFSFLGMFLNDGSSQIGRIRMTYGNTDLGFGVTDSPVSPDFRDLVVADDFIFGNPTAVPESSTYAAIAAIGLCAVWGMHRRFVPDNR